MVGVSEEKRETSSAMGVSSGEAKWGLNCAIRCQSIFHAQSLESMMLDPEGTMNGDIATAPVFIHSTYTDCVSFEMTDSQLREAKTTGSNERATEWRLTEGMSRKYKDSSQSA